ncbi:MAG: hypothetical protein QOE61_1139 [Micromonosporaceae bacterium]|jgi:hypothetical protein|nr:hypothetical protein [Micromonosporaceae bacterium]
MVHSCQDEICLLVDGMVRRVTDQALGSWLRRRVTGKHKHKHADEDEDEDGSSGTPKTPKDIAKAYRSARRAQSTIAGPLARSTLGSLTPIFIFRTITSFRVTAATIGRPRSGT